MAAADFLTRVRFVCELAKRLHQYGTSAPRLEAAIDSVAARLDLSCHSLSTPTSIILSFAERDRGDEALADHTQVLRLAPGDVNLGHLARVDAIAEAVHTGQMDIAAGYRALRAIEREPTRRAVAMTVFAYGLASGTVAALFRGSWTDVAVAAAIGWSIGGLSLLAERRREFAPAFEAVAALVAAFLAILVHAWLVPLSLTSVMIASLIVLLPGLMLTTAVNELATQHLVSGVARFAGAGAILLKLAFGTVAAIQIGRALGLPTVGATPPPLPDWAEWAALFVGSYAFAVLFRASRGDFPLVMASAWIGYLATRIGGALVGAEFGVFIAGLLVSSLANLYGRRRNRPGALVRVPGIILLVPGSVGFRSLFFAFERELDVGLATAVSMLGVLIALVAGLLFGNVLVPPRRSLS